MEGHKIGYYLEDLNRVRSLSYDKLEQWKDEYPYSQLVHFLIAKKHQLDGKVSDLSVFHRASYYSVDRDNLYKRMVASECETGEEVNTLEKSTMETAPLNLREGIIAEEAFISGEIEEIRHEEISNEELQDSINTEEKLPGITDIHVEMESEHSSEAEQKQEEIEIPQEETVILKQTKTDADYTLSPFARWLESLQSSGSENNREGEVKDEKGTMIDLKNNDQSPTTEISSDNRKKKKKKVMYAFIQL